ncbi:MAG: ABC transporter ATP-binding protein [bacterium]|nr:ABC transporter ATP-binding protein [bacterium]
MTILEAEGISKRFGRLQAVEDVSLSVESGDVYGFLGPNGAGKTTSIRMMLGLITPSSGSARISGHDVRTDFKRAISNVGALVEGPAFYGYLSARKNLHLFGLISGGIDRRRIDEVLQLVGLGRRGDQKVSGYSQGMRQRLGIALALLERPRLLVLDEPTNGLDPQGMREIRNLIRRIRDEEGTTIFLSSHLLGELEQVCDRIAIIFRGRIIREGRLDELLGERAAVIDLQVRDEEDERTRDLLRGQFGIEAEILRRGHLEFPGDRSNSTALNRALLEQGISVVAISTRRQTLEEYFVELTGSSQEVV